MLRDFGRLSRYSDNDLIYNVKLKAASTEAAFNFLKAGIAYPR
jgi:hypothetical protein